MSTIPDLVVHFELRYIKVLHGPFIDRSSHVIRSKGWLGTLLTGVILSEPWLHSEPGRGGSWDWKWGQIVGLCCSRQNGCTVTKASENTWITCIPVLQCTSSLFNIPSIITKSLFTYSLHWATGKKGVVVSIFGKTKDHSSELAGNGVSLPT